MTYFDVAPPFKAELAGLKPASTKPKCTSGTKPRLTRGDAQSGSTEGNGGGIFRRPHEEKSWARTSEESLSLAREETQCGPIL